MQDPSPLKSDETTQLLEKKKTLDDEDGKYKADTGRRRIQIKPQIPYFSAHIV